MSGEKLVIGQDRVPANRYLLSIHDPNPTQSIEMKPKHQYTINLFIVYLTNYQ
jgi:hypothetical protein